MNAHVSSSRLTSIREQVSRKNDLAHAIGIALIGYEMEKAKVMSSGGKGIAQKLGAVQVEYERIRARTMTAVARADAAQKAMGEAALAEIGLASDKRVFTIDVETGEVLELIDGAYLPVEAS